MISRSALALGLFAVAALAAVPAKPTFSKDIVPIFQEKCQECHHTGSMAPMSLVSYDETRPWAKSIKQRVATHQMPPWHIDKTVGISHFINDRSLNNDQIETIVRWVDNGSPLGDVKDAPPARIFSDTTDGNSPPNTASRTWSSSPRITLCRRTGRTLGSSRKPTST